MAGTFYGSARNDMNARMRDKADRRVTATGWETPVKKSARATETTASADSRGGLFARAWRLVTRPAVRRTESASSM